MSFGGRVEVVAMRDLLSRRVELAVARFVRPNGEPPTVMECAKPEWVAVSEAEPYFPLVKLEMDQAQKLMDSLWDCGLRPSEGSGSAGAMAAVQKHLEDMRVIAFGAVGTFGIKKGDQP